MVEGQEKGGRVVDRGSDAGEGERKRSGGK